MTDHHSSGPSPEFGYHPPASPSFPPASGQALSDSLTGRTKPGSMKLGIILLAIGLLVAAVLGVLAFQRFPDVGSYPRTSGQAQPVSLTAGGWTVFAEGGSLAPPHQITAPDGSPVLVQPMLSNQTYSLGGHHGQSVGTIDAPVDGVYLVTTEPGHIVAFGQDFGSELLGAIGMIFAAVLGGGLLVVAGTVVLVVTQVRRSRVYGAGLDTNPGQALQ